MKRNFARFAVFAVLALSLFALQGAHAAAPSGTATASSYLVRIVAGDNSVSLGSDVAEAVRGDGTSALARLVAGRAGSTSVGAGERTATKSSESGRTDIAQQSPKSVGGLLTLGAVDAAVEAKITSVNVQSLVELALGDSTALGGLAQIGESASTSRTLVNDSYATSTRSIHFDGIEVLALGDFLAALEVDPFALGCDAVETVGAKVGRDTSAACEQLVAARNAIDGATSTLEGARDDLLAQKSALEAQVAGHTRQAVQADHDTVEGLSCGALDVLCQAAALVTMGAFDQVYGVNVAPLSYDAARTALLNATNTLLDAFDDLDQATTDLAFANGGLADAAAGTCDAVSGALRDVAADVPALAPVLDPAAAAVDTACAALSGLLEGLLDTPLLTVGGVNLSMTAIAREGTPEAEVAGTVDSLKVGILDPVAIDLSIVSDKVDEVTALIGDKLAEITAAIGLDLPLPEFQLLVKDSDKGQRSDGTWFARGSVTALRVHLPAAQLDVPDVLPLGILGSGTLGATAIQASPELTVDLAVFEAAAEYEAAGSTGGGGSDDGDSKEGLPATGLEDRLLLAVLGGLALGGAALVRRYLAAAR